MITMKSIKKHSDFLNQDVTISVRKGTEEEEWNFVADWVREDGQESLDLAVGDTEEEAIESAMDDAESR